MMINNNKVVRSLKIATLIALPILANTVLLAGTILAQESVVVAAPDDRQVDSWETAGVVSELAPTLNDPLKKLLPSPTKSATQTGGSMLGSIDAKTKRSIAKMVGGLAIVVAVFVVFATIFGKKKAANGRAGGAAMEILSRSALNKSQQMQLVRFGNRLLLIASSEHRVDTLAEIVDPQEISEIEYMLREGDTSFFERTRQRLGTTAANPSRRQPVYEA